MEKEPLISRLAEAYEKQKYTYFVTDGEGNCMAEGLTEVDARVFAIKNGWSIGRQEQFTGEPPSNDDGTPITYENKDELNEEDFATYGGM